MSAPIVTLVVPCYNEESDPTAYDGHPTSTIREH